MSASLSRCLPLAGFSYEEDPLGECHEFLDTVRQYALIPLPQLWCAQGEALACVTSLAIEMDPRLDDNAHASFVNGMLLAGWEPEEDEDDYPTPLPVRMHLSTSDSHNVERQHDHRQVTVYLASASVMSDFPDDLSDEQCSESYELLGRGGNSKVFDVKAQTCAGFLYAGLTFGRILADGDAASSMLVRDWPRFAHRGFMMDVARSYQPMPVLKGIVLAGAALKLNVLHLHLVDDQGWRIEITNEGRKTGDTCDYTRLHHASGATAVSAGENPGFDDADETTGTNSVHDDVNQGYEAVPAGRTGWYTQQELRELVRFARQLNVQIIPELEFPGHNHSVLHALPELATAGAWVQAEGDDGMPRVEAWTRWQVGYSYLDFDNPATWNFAEHIMRQCAQIFGTHCLHLGADECYNLVKQVGVARYEEIVNRVVVLARELGFQQVTLWQEGVRALASSVSQPASVGDVSGASSSRKADAVQLWNYTDPTLVDELLVHARRGGVDIINSDARHLYLDQKIDLADSRGLTWAVAEGLTTRETYLWDPLQHIPNDLHSSVRGIEACLWSETVRSVEDIAYLGLPRLAAIAEVAWTDQKRRSWVEVSGRLRVSDE